MKQRIRTPTKTRKNQAKKRKIEPEQTKEKLIMFKECIGCGCAIEKDGGCNLMECPNCNTRWCWVCLQKKGETRDDDCICCGYNYIQT